jgi:hypothetical protein
MKWLLSGSHTEPDTCNDLAVRNSRGLGKGEYLLSEVPRYPQHPNELCTLAPVVVDDAEAARLVRAAMDGALDPTLGDTGAGILQSRSLQESQDRARLIGAPVVIGTEAGLRGLIRAGLMADERTAGPVERGYGPAIARLEEDIENRMAWFGSMDVSQQKLIEVQDAVNANYANPTFRALTDQFGSPPVILTKAQTERQINSMSNADYDDLTGSIRVWEYPGDLSDKVWSDIHKNNAPKPGMLVSSEELGLTGTLRHEYGHYAWKQTPYASQKEWVATRPDYDTRVHDVSYYAGETVSSGYPEDIAEIVAINTSPKYNGDDFEPWVTDAYTRIRGVGVGT